MFEVHPQNREKESGTMGMAKINVWLSETDNPCKVYDSTFYVSVFTCDGKILKWAEKEYKLLKAQNGHLEIKLPPGCYYLRAASISCENAYSDSAIVRVNCGETACVTLMIPSLKRCVGLLAAGLRLARARELVPSPLLRRAQATLDELMKEIELPALEFEIAHIDETVEFLRKEE